VRAPALRSIDPVSLAMAERLVRRTDAVLEQIDRLNGTGGLGDSERENLARSAVQQLDPFGGAFRVDGLHGVRTDFIGVAGRTDDGMDILTLVEMTETNRSAGRGGGSEAASDRPSTPVDRGPLPGFGETVWRDLKRIHLDLWEDTRRVYWNPTNAIILITAGGASLALRPEVDDDIEDYYDEHHTMSDGWRQTFGWLGNPAFHFALAGAWYLAGQQAQHAKTYEVGKTLFSALIINGLSTVTLKLAACTDGPNDEPFAWPSGHVSSAFTVAAVMHQAYGPWAGIPLYGVAGMVGLARMDDREHHFSDVIFGAALGLVVGHTVAGGHRPQIFGGDIIPYADPTNNSAGVAWFKMTK